MAVTERITFDATVARLSTLADGGLRLTLDLPETAVMQAAQLMECKRVGVVLKVECEPCEQEPKPEPTRWRDKREANRIRK